MPFQSKIKMFGDRPVSLVLCGSQCTQGTEGEDAALGPVREHTPAAGVMPVRVPAMQLLLVSGAVWE